MSTATLPAPSASVVPPAAVSPTPFVTLGDVLRHLGDIPADRVRLWPWPGTATVEDALFLDAKKIAVCELVDGILVEKAMGMPESWLAAALLYFVETYLENNNIGFVSGEGGTLRLADRQLRIPDVGFFSWDGFPDRRRPREQAPRITPTLAVEVLSPSNTRAEMARKRREYFAAGTRLVWEVEPDDRVVRVYTDADTFTAVGDDGTLDGGAVLPGFALGVRRWFDRANRDG
jgi:Uma2 family endonuclease